MTGKKISDPAMMPVSNNKDLFTVCSNKTHRLEWRISIHRIHLRRSLLLCLKKSRNPYYRDTLSCRMQCSPTCVFTDPTLMPTPLLSSQLGENPPLAFFYIHATEKNLVVLVVRALLLPARRMFLSRLQRMCCHKCNHHNIWRQGA